jgi:hypothetical protein
VDAEADPAALSADDDDLTQLRDDLTQLLRDDEQLLAGLMAADDDYVPETAADDEGNGDPAAAAASLRSVLAALDEGTITAPTAVRQRLVGVILALEAV